jgi:hypothetical protein
MNLMIAMNGNRSWGTSKPDVSNASFLCRQLNINQSPIGGKYQSKIAAQIELKAQLNFCPIAPNFLNLDVNCPKRGHHNYPSAFVNLRTGMVGGAVVNLGVRHIHFPDCDIVSGDLLQ